MIIESHFPEEITFLIVERNGIIDEMALSLLKEFEEKLYSYHIDLKENCFLIFDIEIVDDDKISYFYKISIKSGLFR